MKVFLKFKKTPIFKENRTSEEQHVFAEPGQFRRSFAYKRFSIDFLFFFYFFKMRDRLERNKLFFKKKKGSPVFPPANREGKKQEEGESLNLFFIHTAASISDLGTHFKLIK